MGIFSKIFGGGNKITRGKIVNGRNPGKGYVYANRFNRARGGFAGGYGAWTFGNIMNAHSDAEEIVATFGLDQKGCGYVHPDLGMSCYNYAYQEELEEATEELMEAILKGEEDAELKDFIDWDQIEEDAYEYACELADMYIKGSTWIPIAILEWAYYEVSDHNG